MRVTHVMASAAAGGGATYLKWLLPGLADRNVRSSLITGTDGQLGAELRQQGFEVQNLDLMRSRFSPLLAYTLRRHVFSSRPHIVHAHGTRAAFYCSLAGLHRRFPTVYTAHGLAFRDSQGFFRRGVMKGAEWLAIGKFHNIRRSFGIFVLGPAFGLLGIWAELYDSSCKLTCMLD